MAPCVVSAVKFGATSLIRSGIIFSLALHCEFDRHGEDSERVAGQGWHSDVSCNVEPPSGSILHIQQAPDVCGDTMFASVYDALSDPMKEFLGGLSAKHESRHHYLGRNQRTGMMRDGPNAYSEAKPSGRPHPSGKRSQGAVCELGLHDRYRRAIGQGKPSPAWLPMRAYQHAGIPLPIQVTRKLRSVLG